MPEEPLPSPTRRNFLKTAALAGAGTVAGAAAINEISPHLLPEKFEFELNKSFWARCLPQANAAMTRDLDADIAIIGGGFTGLAAAYY